MNDRSVIPVLVTALAVCVPLSVHAEAYEKTFENYVLRSSTVSTDNLSTATAKAHGIERSPRKAVINVTVINKNAVGESTVPAKVAVSTIDPGGYGRDIEMRETTENGYVSYSGVYALVGREGIELDVSAQPVGSDKTLTMRFRDKVRIIGNDLIK